VDAFPLQNVDWTEEWKRGIGVRALGNLTIAPPWLATDLDLARTIVIEPAMAFGTGEHASTRGSIRLLQSVVRPGDRVADLGAGSAILSIAASKLGARHVAAIEIDPDAIGNANENVRRNGVAETVTIIEGDASVLLPLVAPVRVVLANIISSVLIELLPTIAFALEPDGRAILSGILVDERESMSNAFASGGWRIENEDSEDGWWSTTIARP
jgi:ribosomal protein L11 methyltransferase